MPGHNQRQGIDRGIRIMKRESIGRILISYFGMLRYKHRFYIYMVFVFCIAYTMEQGIVGLSDGQ